jgi:hypothetical protein
LVVMQLIIKGDIFFIAAADARRSYQCHRV